MNHEVTDSVLGLDLDIFDELVECLETGRGTPERIAAGLSSISCRMWLRTARLSVDPRSITPADWQQIKNSLQSAFRFESSFPEDSPGSQSIENVRIKLREMLEPNNVSLSC